jgi:HK97 gp10 family phage protein
VALTSRIPQIIAGSYAKGVMVVRRATARIESGAKRRARVDTGNMRGGWQSDNNGLTGIVFNLVDYTIHNEFGTVNMSAQPMLRPAVEETRPEFVREAALIYR